jgi:hypothetical protein
MMDTLASKTRQLGAWVSVENDLPPESTDDAFHEFLASDGEMITVATSDGTGFFDDQGDGFIARLWMPIPDRWARGLPPVDAEVLVKTEGATLITSYDGDGWAVGGARIAIEHFDFEGWQPLPELAK